MPRAVVLRQTSEDFEREWDELAIELGKPLSAPAWALAWGRHVAPAGTATPVVAVREGEELLGVLPLATRGRLQMRAGGDLLAIEPLARPGREPQVAAALSQALDESARGLAAVRLEQDDDGPRWDELLSAKWPRRPPFRQVDQTVPVPKLRLDGRNFEEWLGSQSANFRHQVSRKWRRLEEDGARFRLATEPTIAADVDTFLRLHRHRHPRGTSLNTPGTREMLIEVATAHIPSGRFRLLLLEVDGNTVAALLLTAAGKEVLAWNSGMDESFAHRSPMNHCFVQAIREIAAHGENTLNMGPGDYEYKRRLASEESTLRTFTLIPRDGATSTAALALETTLRTERALIWAARRRLGPLRHSLERLIEGESSERS